MATSETSSPRSREGGGDRPRRGRGGDRQRDRDRDREDGEFVEKAAPQGTGIIAGGPMRAIFEALGVQDVVAKSVGTSNPHNMIKATFEALGHLTSPRAVAARRGKKVAEILGRNVAEARETA